MSRFCSECGYPLPDGARFCENCGAAFAPAQAQPAAEVQPTEPLTYQQENMTPQVPAPWQVQQPMQADVPPQTRQGGQMPMPQQSYQPLPQPQPQYRVATPINAGAQQRAYAVPVAPGDTGGKSHLGLGIGVTVVIVLLIAALIAGAIILFVVYNPFKSSSDSPQDLLNKEDEYYYNTDSGDIESYRSLYYDYVFNYSKAEQKEDIKYYTRLQKEDREYYKSEYGDDVTCKTEILSERTLSGSELSRRIAYYTDASTDEPDQIEEIREAEVTYTYSGSKDSLTMKGTVEFIKRDGKWYIGAWGDSEQA